MPSGRSVRFRTAAGALIVVCLQCSLAGSAETGGETAPSPINFARDVRPILEKRCFSCHGSDRQESDLRLDRRDDALKGGENGVAIVPGKASDSALVERISGSDPDLRMPPKGELLPAESVALIRAWIDQGANWPTELADAADKGRDHWSLKPLQRPPLPEVDKSWAAKNPIDAFILARLKQNGLRPSPEADRLTLLRRVTFDLTGLPPTPAEASAFLADTAPDAYERLVERLLASPRYGERWARHWIDVSHFAETHGNDQDRPRPNAWPYRDYLIRAFNEDKPYSRFVGEQVAGDVLYPDDPQATAALGFLAAGPWDESSLQSIVDDTDDKRIAQVLDRDDVITTVMSAFTSTTVHCARCHNHKFDPISQADYYSLQAVFSGVDKAERQYDPDPAVHDRRAQLAARKAEVASLSPEQLLADPIAASQLAESEQAIQGVRESWRVIAPASYASANGSIATPQADGSLLFGGTRPETDTYTLTLETDLPSITGIQLEVTTDPSLPHEGPGRQDNGNLHLSEFKLLAAPAAGGDPVVVPLASASADFNQGGWEIGAALDGKRETAWGIYPEVGKHHAAVFVLREPLRVEGRTRLIVVLDQLHGGGHLIGRPRISVTTSANPGAARAIPAAVEALLALSPADRSVAQQAELARFLINFKLDADLAALPPPQTVFAASNSFKPDGNFKPAVKPREVRLLRRGDIHQPLQEAVAGTISCLPVLESRFTLEHPDDEGARRAALARWLVDPQNVLTWRSIANRVWHYHFDRGIVDTPNDLGVMGGQPSHPELLDWLAVELRDGGGSLKKLHRLIVCSATYRQSAQIDEERSRVDADNRLLWRMNRTRLDAESIRDAVLQISGKLDLTMGGPSVKQFVQSPGIHVTPNVDYLGFNVDDPANYRRSIYRFLFRTLPDPFMESLDCPDGSQLAPGRSASVTALQALAMLDDRFIIRQSEHTAARLVQSAAALPEQIGELFRLVLLRDPAPAETTAWQAYAQQHGLANACRLMFNTNEFIFIH